MFLFVKLKRILLTVNDSSGTPYDFPMFQDVRQNRGWVLQAERHLVWFPSLLWPQAKMCPAELICPQLLHSATLWSTEAPEVCVEIKWEIAKSVIQEKLTEFNGENCQYSGMENKTSSHMFDLLFFSSLRLSASICNILVCIIRLFS